MSPIFAALGFDEVTHPVRRDGDKIGFIVTQIVGRVRVFNGKQNCSGNLEKAVVSGVSSKNSANACSNLFAQGARLNMVLLALTVWYEVF
jgi:hypothetical protein